MSAFNNPVPQLADRLLPEAGVAALLGTDFSKFGNGFFRLCYATSPDEIKLGIEKLGNFLIKEFYFPVGPLIIMSALIFSNLTGPIPDTS